jgi:amidophosphoribosyltransferase
MYIAASKLESKIMSDELKHECGIAMIRLLKPLEYYQKKYNTSLYALNKMYLLMQKQVNRGQDGAGLANIKLDLEPGKRYISRYRSNKSNSVQKVFQYINKKFEDIEKTNPGKLQDVQWLKENAAFSGELFLGHLRYGTYGGNSIEQCHPFLRQNNWMTRNLVLAGNFNMTNVDELFNQLIDLGQHPKEKSDTVTILEKIGHFLDEENSKLYHANKEDYPDKQEMAKFVAKNINVKDVLVNSAKKWDGGYVMCGLMGHGDAFVLRDPAGIRPGFYYKDDEIVVVASERAVIQTAMNVPQDSISEITPGHALIVKKDGRVSMDQITEPQENKACSFERIYFSRGNDADIYNERKKLGKLISLKVMESIGGDLKNSVFSFIPNTAETSFYGMVEGLESLYKDKQAKRVLELGSNCTTEQIKEIFSFRPRV